MSDKPLTTVTSKLITPEELDELERCLRGEGKLYAPKDTMQGLIATIRAAWAERDRYKAAFDDSDAQKYALQRILEHLPDQRSVCKQHIEAGRAAEREECAKLAETKAQAISDTDWVDACNEIAEAIRARGTQKG
jgi:hypothetical protein